MIDPVPEIVEVNTDPGRCNAIVHWEDAFADNCGNPQLKASHESGDLFELGTTTVTLTTMDIHFNVTTETFDVVVTDAEAAEFTSFPDDIQLIAEPGLCSAMADWDAATASDNCGVASIVSDRPLESTSMWVPLEVTFTLTDVNGNVTEDSILITVEDLELPVIAIFLIASPWEPSTESVLEPLHRTTRTCLTTVPSTVWLPVSRAERCCLSVKPR